MKQISLYLTGIILGGFFGFIVSNAELNYIKTSNRETSYPITTIIGILIGSTLGLIIANTLNKSLINDKKYGFDSIKLYTKQAGRKWVYQSIWTNPDTGNQNSITTCYHNGDKNVYSFLNEDSVINHYSTSGSKINIEKNHINGLNKIKIKIINGELNGYLK